MTLRLRLKARRGKWDNRFLNGHPGPGSLNSGALRFIMRGVGAGLVVTATRDGQHAPGSFHYIGAAVDLGLERKLIGTARGRKRMVRFQRNEAKRRASRYLELFGPDNNYNVKNGRRISLAEGTALENQHDSHVHGALK